MNHLIITTGNSDVQLRRSEIENTLLPFQEQKQDNRLNTAVIIGEDVINVVPNRDHADWYLLGSCRNDGELLLKHFDVFAGLIHLPLIQPSIQHILDKGGSLARISIIYTNQQDARFKKGDTVFIKDVISALLIKQLPGVNIDFFPIEKVTDIDELYPLMWEKVRQWREQLPEGGEMFLADQGGIDQINQSVRLQLLQAFKSRVHILQKAEGADAKELQFPQLFLRDLARQNIIKHVSDYDFDKVDDTLQPESWVVKLCHYAAQRLALKYENIYQCAETANGALKKANQPRLELWHWKKMRETHRLETNRIIIRDLYTAAKIQYYNGRYQEVIWRLFAVYENLLREPIDALLQTDSLHKAFKGNRSGYDENKVWEDLLEKLEPGLTQKLQEAGVYTSNPNRLAYSYIFHRLVGTGSISVSVTSQEMKGLEKALDNLAGKRNGIVHKMGNVSKEGLGDYFSSLEGEGFKLLDKWFSISGMGDFDLYRNQILSYYQ